MSLSRRVASLEDGAPGPCSECGHDPDAVVSYSIIWEDAPDAPQESSPPCLGCGNISTLVIDWEDEMSEGPQDSYKKLHARQDDDAVVEGAAAQVPDYPPRWNDSEARGGVDG